MGMPISSFFKIDARKAIVIGSSIYDKLRETKGNEGFSDLPEVYQDVKTVVAGLRRLKFHKSQIQVMLDPSFSDVKHAIDQSSCEI